MVWALEKDAKMLSPNPDGMGLIRVGDIYRLTI